MNLHVENVDYEQNDFNFVNKCKIIKMKIKKSKKKIKISKIVLIKLIQS